MDRQKGRYKTYVQRGWFQNTKRNEEKGRHQVRSTFKNEGGTERVDENGWGGVYCGMWGRGKADSFLTNQTPGEGGFGEREDNKRWR